MVDGTDVLAVYREARRAIEKARAGGGPTLLECVTLRMEGHAVHDDAFYVPRGCTSLGAVRSDRALPRLADGEHLDGFSESDEEIKADVKRSDER